MFDLKWRIRKPGEKNRTGDNIEAVVELYQRSGSAYLVFGISAEGGGFTWWAGVQNMGIHPRIAAGWKHTLTEATEEAEACAEPLLSLIQAAIAHDREVRAGRDK